jgi:hypothetical protein
VLSANSVVLVFVWVNGTVPRMCSHVPWALCPARSHLIALLGWIYMCYVVQSNPLFMSARAGTQLVVRLGCVLGSSLFIGSVVAHTFHCMGPNAAYWAWRLDYAGVCVSWFVPV